MRKFLVFLLVSVVHLSFYSQNSVNYTISELKADYSELRCHLETRNPIAYLYTPREAVSNYLDSLGGRIDKPMSELDFYRLISPAASLIKDGHNLIMPSKELTETIVQHQKHFPLDISLVNEEIYVVENHHKSTEIEKGDKVLSINGISVDSIYHRLLLVLPHEGLQTQLSESYIDNWFRYFYHLHFGFEEVYKIKYEKVLHNNEVKEISLNGLSLKEMDELSTVSKEILYGMSLDIIDSISGSALLRIPSFAPRVLQEKFNQKHFKRRIDRYFQRIEDLGITNLIIDIRGNNGGNPDYSAYLLKQIMPKPFIQAEEGRIVCNIEEEEVSSRTKRKWLPWYGIGRFKPKKDAYNGRVYVLIDGGTFSAAVEFCSVLRKYNRALFFGEETGGNPIVMSGNYIKESRRLRNTGISHFSGNICTLYADLSLNQGRGIIPEYPVLKNFEDLLSPKDRCLQLACTVILAEQRD